MPTKKAPSVVWATLVTAFLAPALLAQQRSLRFDVLSVEDGLSQGSVNDIRQTREGFLYFATREGLNRFDGYELKVYKQATDELWGPSDILYALAEDGDGALWIGTGDGGLKRFHPATEELTAYRHDPEDPASLVHDYVTNLLVDRTGTLWIATRGGLDRFDRQRRAFVHQRPPAPDPFAVTVLRESADGALWVGSHRGLHRLDRGRRTWKSYRHQALDPGSLSHDDVRSIHQDRSGTIWIGTWGGGLNRWDPVSDTFARYRARPDDPRALGDGRVAFVLEDRRGVFWVGAYGAGLHQLDRATGIFTRFSSWPPDRGSLSSNFVLSIYEDRSGVLWIGTQGAGVNRVVRRGFEHYKVSSLDPEATAKNTVRALHQDGSGILWIGTFQAGLLRFDRRSGRGQTLEAVAGEPAGLRSNRVRALASEPDGPLWIGTCGGGLHELDTATGVFRHHEHRPGDPASLAHDCVNALAAAGGSGGEEPGLWVGTYGGGVQRLNLASRTFTRAEVDEEESTQGSVFDVFALVEDSDATLWVATRRGLLRMTREERAAGRFRHYLAGGEPTSLSDNHVIAVHRGRGNALWAGTHGGGLNKLDVERDTFVRYTEGDGLANNVVYAILEDDRGHLWVSTNQGLSRFDPDAERFVNYDAHDGLQGNEFNTSAAFSAADGELFFGGLYGWNAFYPNRIRANLNAPPVLITSFKVFDRLVASRVDGRQKLVLSPDDVHFSFEYTALDFVDPEANRYAHKLEGIDHKWVEDGSRRFVSYTDVEPGEYVFRVKAANSDGVWNEVGQSVTVVIAPPFWKTWWFRSLFVLAVASALVGGHFLRVSTIDRRRRELVRINALLEQQIARRRTIEEERERVIAELETKNTEIEGKNAEMERFIYTVSHDLKSPLFTIQGFLGMLQRDVDDGEVESLSEDVRQISSAARRMRQLLDGLLELSRIGRLINEPQEVALEDLAYEAIELVGGQIAERGVQVEVAPGLPRVYGDRPRLLEVLQNLVDNSVKYMGSQPEPRIGIGVREDSEGPVCYVEDNGVGIDPRYRERVFGLFDRLDADGDGDGVGLAIAKRIVEVHGGRIWVESEGKGRGSTVCFTLPPA